MKTGPLSSGYSVTCRYGRVVTGCIRFLNLHRSRWSFS